MTKYLMGTLALPPFLPPSHLDAVSPFPPFAPSLLDQASLSFLGHSATLDLSRGAREGENGHVLDGGKRERACAGDINVRAAARPVAAGATRQVDSLAKSPAHERSLIGISHFDILKRHDGKGLSD